MRKLGAGLVLVAGLAAATTGMTQANAPGVLRFEEPVSAEARQLVEKTMARDLKDARDIQRESMGRDGDKGVVLSVTELDLNADKTPEIVAIAEGLYFCGSQGCTINVYRRSPDGLVLIGAFTGSEVSLVGGVTNGYQDLRIDDSLAVTFNGTDYKVAKQGGAE